MGTWNITIKGHGCHHNKRVDDAEVMSAAFVSALRAAGHEVTSAEFELTGQVYNIAALNPDGSVPPAKIGA